MELNWSDQKLFVVNDIGYNRMLKKIKNGTSKFEWSYRGTCPHKNNKDCKCEKMMNVIDPDDNNRLLRVCKGKRLPVYRLSEMLSEMP